MLALTLSLAGCGRDAPRNPASEAGPAAAPAAAAKPAPPVREPSWESKTVLDVISFQAPDGAGWNSGFDTWYRGQLPGPRALFAVRSGGEIERFIRNSKAASKGETTLGDAKATLYEGIEPDWGPIKMWVFADKHPARKVDVAVLVAGVAQDENKAVLDKILQSLKVSMTAGK